MACHPEVAGHRQFKSAPQGISVNGGNHRGAQVFDQVKEFFLPPSRQGGAFLYGEVGKLRNIGPGHKGFAALAGKEDHPDLRVGIQGCKGLVQFCYGSLVEGVELIGPVDGQGCQRGLLHQEDVLEFHDTFCFGSTIFSLGNSTVKTVPLPCWEVNVICP